MRSRFIAFLLFCCINFVQGQVTLFSEGIGVPAANPTAISAHTFQHAAIFTYSGSFNTEVRNSAASNYPGASGTGNVYFTNNQSWFQIEGINTVGMSDLSLSFGHYKASAASAQTYLIKVWVSDDGVAWSELTYTRPSTAGWAWVLANGSIPSTSNLRIKFNNPSATNGVFRLDDIKLMGTPTVSWANVQFPASGSIITGGNHVVYSRVYSAGFTYVEGAQSGMVAELGYSTNNSDPSGADWTWIPALYSTQAGNNDEYLLDLGGEIFFPGTYYYASRFSAAGGPYIYGGYSSGGGGIWNGTTNVSGVLNVIDSQVVYANTQSPFSGTQSALQPYNVYAQVYQPGLTEGPTQGMDVQAWIGYSQTNTDPNSAGWSWVPAMYNPSVTGNNDEYVADIGPYLNTNTTFYYASRFQLGTGTYSYGGFHTSGSPGHFWDGATYVSGSVVITGASNPGDYYRSKATGAWEAITTWESSPDNITWQNATRSPSNTATSIVIRSGHTITSSTNVTADDLTIDLGGTLDIASGTFTLNNGTAAVDLQVNGNFTNSGATFTNTGALSVLGTYNHATSSLTLPIAAWQTGSTCNVTGLTNVSQTPLINGGQVFHNFTVNNSNAQHLVSILGPVFQVNGTLTLGPNPASYLLLATTSGTYTRTINKIVIYDGQLTISGSQSNVMLNVLDDVMITGGRLGLSGGLNGKATVNVTNNVTVGGVGILSMIDHASAQSPTLNVSGDLVLTGDEPYLDLESVSSSGAVATVNVSGNFVCNAINEGYPIVDFGNGTVINNVVNIGGNFTKTGDGTFTTSSSNAAKGFVFAGAGTVQTFSDTGAYISDRVNYTINSGASVLLGTNLTLGGGTFLPHSQFRVSIGGTLNFGTSSIIATDATSKFLALGTAAPASTLITSNPDGFGGVTSTGSLQNFASVGTSTAEAVQLQVGVNYTFNADTTTPFPVPGATVVFTNIGNLTINANVQSNMESQLTLQNSLTINDGATYVMNPLSILNDHRFNPGSVLTIAPLATLDNGGENRVLKGSGSPTIIINGRFVTRDAQGFIGTNAAVSGYSAGVISLGANSVVEYALTGDQAVQGGTAPAYVNVGFSGSGVKTLQSANAVSGTITVSDSAIFDAVNNTFGNAGTNVTMTGTSVYKTGGSGVKPDAGGIYSLSPGTKIAFYSPSVANTNPRKSGILYADVDISGNNIINTGVTGLKFHPGATFTVKSNGIFKLENPAGFTGAAGTSIDNTAPPTVVLESGSTIEYSAAADQTITPFNPAYANLKISGSGTKSFAFSPEIKGGEDLIVAGATLQIDPDVTMTVTDAVLNSGGIIDIKNAGSLVQVTDVINATSNNNVGNIKMTRNANDMYRYDFTYWSSPVTLSSAFTLNDLSPFTRTDKYFKWSAGTQSWQLIMNGTENMIPGLGYIARAPENFPTSPGLTLPFSALFEGVPNNGIVTTPVSGSTSLAVADYKFNLLGNPYPSAVFADCFISANLNLGGTLYFWTHNTAVSGTPDVNGEYYYAQADYATYNMSGGTAAAPSAATGGANTNIPTGKIAAGQGFFVRGITDGASTATFNNSMRIAGQNGQFFRNASGLESAISPNIERHRIWLNLTNEQGGFSQTLTAYAEGATNGLDRLFDGELLGGQAVAFYSLVDNTLLTSQGRALPFDESDTVPLGYKAATDGPLTITLDFTDGLFDNQNVYIEDMLLNVTHDIKQSVYTFAGSTGTFNNRFLLRFTTGSLGVDTVSNNDFTIYVKNRNIHLWSDGKNIDTVTVYDLLGHKLYFAEDVNSYTLAISDVVLSTQVLIVKTTLTDGAVVIRKIVY
jgi:hypothetical protein